MIHFHTIGSAWAVDYPFADLDISGSARTIIGATRSTRGVLVSDSGEKKQVLVAPEAGFAALVEGRLPFSDIPAPIRTFVGVVAPPPIQGATDPKSKKRSVKDAPWFLQAKGMDVTLTIPKLIRESALRAADRAGILGFQLTVFITLAPNIDGLSPPERVKFWRKCLNRLRAYCRQREKKLGRPFPAVYLATRESDPITHLDEHLHLLAHAPDRAEADHMAEVVRKWFKKKRSKATAGGEGVEASDGSVDADVVEDPNAAHAKRVDTRERFRGGKLRSVVRYVFKAANPQSWKFDSTILWKLSGAIAGPRVFISRNITNREVVAATRDAVDAVECARQNLIQAGRDTIVPAPGSSAAIVATPPADVAQAEVRADAEVYVRADHQGATVTIAAMSDVPAAPAPVLAAAIELAIYPGPVSAGPVRRGAERQGADVVVEVEIPPVELAPTVPAPVSRELDLPAVMAAVVHAEDPASPLPTDAAIAPAVGVVTAIQTVIVSPDVSAESGPTPSFRGAVLAPLAALGRSMARGAAACVGWIASRLSAGPPPLPAGAEPRAPLFHPSTIPAAGAFFGAPDVLSDPW